MRCEGKCGRQIEENLLKIVSIVDDNLQITVCITEKITDNHSFNNNLNYKNNALILIFQKKLRTSGQ